MSYVDPLYKFKKQFQEFVDNNPNVIASSSQIPDSAKAVIVLSPGSIYHQFKRDWVSKSYKKTIVERPERLLACCLGIGAAVTMYPALFTLKSVPSLYSSSNSGGINNIHRIEKKLNSSHVLKVHGNEWPNKLIKLCKESDKKLANGEVEVPDTWNSGDIYLSSSTLEAIYSSITALETGVDSILNSNNANECPNRCFVAVRPPGHHCHFEMPEGFCLLNNVQVAIQYASDKYGITHAVILDYDLHHGDGTQDICFKRALEKNNNNNKGRGKYTGNKGNQNNKKDDDAATAATDDGDDDSRDCNNYVLKKYGVKVGYFSMQDINSFPTEVGFSTAESIAKASTCIMDSQNLNIWNIHLDSWNNNEQEFDKLYNNKYRMLFAKADEFFTRAKFECGLNNGPAFKGLVIISSGFDASEYESPSMQRHQVNVPTKFYNMFMKDALKLAQIHTNGKLLSVLEGGYSDGAIISGTFSHLIGLQNQNWIMEWGSKQVIKEISRGCKLTWKPYKTRRNNDVIRVWAEEVIKLGRSMIPEFKPELFDKELEKKLGINKHNIILRSSKTRNSGVDINTNTNKINIVKSEKPTILNQYFPDDEQDYVDEEDKDYVYNEELNKTFNKTVEDITIDDISRHLETLDIIDTTFGTGNGSHKMRAKKTKNIPSSFLYGSGKVDNIKYGDEQQQDISMISQYNDPPSARTRNQLSQKKQQRGQNDSGTNTNCSRYHSTRSGRTQW
ncbi:related to Histone deacetylase HOS3 [Saccharomycodes ludwigii]|uniref:Related to Histone deacetylase HOS3 n=1 Tax=Saccharomycodes ludwigii TaxID=36035 RepID=A0A376BAV2_9ASCO|nr:hypothetical protein SCDLUD_002081 [Saccharomycodes ludwigii]KAH3902264.1 hypothetical protein SCDLUD_002081 [Saccharomycodes ludwigii]SSD61731.1 related to Histone deacetylase HOS3 [Saccharomycodes ludwigii]